MALNLDDPILRLLPQTSIPAAFLTMAPADQAKRGRLFLVLWAAGTPDWYAWTIALTPEDELGDLADLTASRASDEEIPKMVAGRIAYDSWAASQSANG